MTDKPTHMSLCTGIGGIDLAAEWAGFESVGQCEIADFPTRVLEKHWPNVPRWRDIRDVTAESVRGAGVSRVDLLSAGYPCQPFSLVGKRRGQDDERHIWPEVYRVLRELRPTWFVGENVPGHVSMGLDEVLSDLEEAGYQARPYVLPAYAVGAEHERYRVFVVGYSDRQSVLQADPTVMSFGSKGNSRENVAGFAWGEVPGVYWQENQPPVCGVDDGVPADMDANIALGNAVVPQQVYPILRSIFLINQLLKESSGAV